MAEQRPLRIGVVGAGLIARRAHLPAFAADPLADLAGICSGHRANAQSAAAEFGVRRVYGSWEELVADPGIEAIDICATSALHGPVAIAALHAGKHVLVEKPMALTLDEADAMLAAARRAERVLMVAHNFRYEPLFEAAKEIVSAGTIGAVRAIRGSFMHAGPEESWGATSDWFWQEEDAGGGALIDLGVHIIDLVRWLMADDPVVEVEAMMTRLEKPTFADDNAIALLRFGSGVVGSVQASWTERPLVELTLVVHGERGRLWIDRGAKRPIVMHLQKEGGGIETLLPELPAQSPLGNPFAHFVRVVREGVAPRSSGQEGRDTLAITLAAYEAARTKRSTAVG
jgi:UDP-N-acetylglucosamine 3-dehydrogenase